MKRAVWLLLAALGTVFLPVPPVNGWPMPEDSTGCGIAAHACNDSKPVPGHEQPTGKNPVCLSCCITCCLAVLPASDTLHSSLAPIARLGHLSDKGPVRSDPPPLPPPRRPGC